jgi:hypothetical protein
MSQSQPVIPVTMQYGSGGYGQGQYHHLENEIHRSGDHIKNDVQRTAEHTQADIQRSKDYLGTQATTNTNWVRGDISDSKDKITADVKDGTAVLRSDLANDTATIVANLVAQANADQAQTRASQIESRQATERNADKILADSNRNSDYINGNVKDASVSGLLATQTSAVAGVLATQQSAVATALAVQNTSSDLKTVVTDSRRDITGILQANFAALGVQSEKNAALVSQQVLTQAQAVLLGQKDSEVNASNNRALLALQAADYKAASSLQSSENTKDIQLLAQQNFQATQLQAANFSSLGLLKTAESTAAIMAKLADCCCETRMGFASTQNIVMQNGTNNQAAIQQGQMNQLTQALATAQNEALMARITNSVITTSTNVGSGTISKTGP